MNLVIMFRNGSKIEIPVDRGYLSRLSVTTNKGTTINKVTGISYGDGKSEVLYVDYSEVVGVFLIKQ